MPLKLFHTFDPHIYLIVHHVSLEFPTTSWEFWTEFCEAKKPKAQNSWHSDYYQSYFGAWRARKNEVCLMSASIRLPPTTHVHTVHRGVFVKSIKLETCGPRTDRLIILTMMRKRSRPQPHKHSFLLSSFLAFSITP
jgi:hypothetical protein